MESSIVSIEGLNKADVLAALYNASKPQGMGFLHYDPAPMGREEAKQLLAKSIYFDYLKGRAVMVDLSRDDGFDSRNYDYDKGTGAAERVIQELRTTNSTNTVAISEMHTNSTLVAALDVKSKLRIEDDADETVLGNKKVASMMSHSEASRMLPSAVRRAEEQVKRTKQRRN